MLSIEIKLIDFVKKNIFWIVTVVVTLIFVAIRFSTYDYLSGDMYYFLWPWYDMLKKEGLLATLHSDGTDYNVLYMCFIYIATLLPLQKSLAIKLFSIIFDYFLAGSVAWATHILMPAEKKNRSRYVALSFVLTTMLPLPILNSAVWGQCDSMYTVFAILSLCYFLKEKYTLSVFMLAVSFCFKFQAVFVVPLFVIMYFVRKKYSVLQVLQIPLLLFLVGLFGRYPDDSLFLGLEIYAKQLGTYRYLYMYYPNIWSLLIDIDRGAPFYDQLANAGILLTLASLACMMGIILYKKWDVQRDRLPLLGSWCIFSCVIFLPAMHERYAFAGEILLWVYFLAKPSLKRAGLVLAVYAAPTALYISYLFGALDVKDMYFWGMFNTGAYFFMTWYTLKKMREQNANKIPEVGVDAETVMTPAFLLEPIKASVGIEREVGMPEKEVELVQQPV